ncbi:uncharacterized protein LOC144027838 isoform X2 [Festucalex cinctus]
MSSPAMKTPTQEGGEPCKINTPDDNEYESVCFESHSEARRLNVFLQSSFVYSLNWSVTMKTRRSYRLKTASKKKLDKSPDPSQDVVRRLIQKKRRRTPFDDSSVPHIDNVVSSHVAENPEEGGSVQVDDRGLDDSFEQCGCSTAPSLLKTTGRPPTGFCPSCRKFYQRAKRLKRPIKDKLLDKDPTSLTCDQWVLLKKWKPSRLPHSGKLSHSVLRLDTHLKGKKKPKQKKQDGNKNLCSRLHIFLERNLRRSRKVPARNKRKTKPRKMARDNSRSSQKRLRSNTPPQDNSGNYDDKSNFDSTFAGLDDEGFPGGESADDSKVTNNIPRSLSLETTKLKKPKAPAKEEEDYNTLLHQLRGNTSNIFKESQ